MLTAFFSNIIEPKSGIGSVGTMLRRRKEKWPPFREPSAFEAEESIAAERKRKLGKGRKGRRNGRIGLRHRS
jgi:hypothetical protein